MAASTITTAEEGRVILTEIGGSKPVCLEIHRKLLTGAYEVRAILLSYDEFQRLHRDMDLFAQLPALKL